MTMAGESETRLRLADALDLAGRLYLQGIRREDLAEIRAWPELAGRLPENIDRSLLEAFAAGHYDLFGMNVFPYAAAFLDSSRLLGGAVTEQASHFYRLGGFTPTTTAEAADHLGHELSFSAHLLRAGADTLLARFLHTHLLAWMLPLQLAIRRQKSGFYQALAAFSLSRVEECLAGYTSATDSLAYDFPPLPDGLLHNPDTRLKDIAEYILTPVFSGIYLSRDTIAAMGRQTGIPRGFGDRVQLLTNLFRTGAEYGMAEGVFSLLEVEVRGWIADYTSWEGNPHLAPAARPWKERSRMALELFAQIKDSM